MSDRLSAGYEHSPAVKDGLTGLRALLFTAGGRCALPVYVLLLAGLAVTLMPLAKLAFALQPVAAVSELSAAWWQSVLLSLVLAALVTALLAVICWPVAVALLRVLRPGAAVLTGLMLLFPYVVPGDVSRYGWMLFLQPGGMLDSFLQLFGREGPAELSTAALSAVDLIYSCLPCMLVPLLLGVALVPPELPSAACDLGASRLTVLRDIELLYMNIKNCHDHLL